jgi:NTE family protein
MDHLIASGSLPPSYPAKEIGDQSFWDGGLFDNTPLSSLLKQISSADAATTRVIVINLFPNEGAIPKNMLEVFDRMTELQFANKTGKDVELARKINKLDAIIEQLQGVSAGQAGSIFREQDFADLVKYKVFDNIIAIANAELEPVSSSADFSRPSIERRIAAGYRDAAKDWPTRRRQPPISKRPSPSKPGRGPDQGRLSRHDAAQDRIPG